MNLEEPIKCLCNNSEIKLQINFYTDGHHVETVFEGEMEKNNVSTAIHLEKVGGCANEFSDNVDGDTEMVMRKNVVVPNPNMSVVELVGPDPNVVYKDIDKVRAYSCGVFMLKYAELLFTGIPTPWILEFGQKDIPFIRRLYCFDYVDIKKTEKPVWEGGQYEGDANKRYMISELSFKEVPLMVQGREVLITDTKINRWFDTIDNIDGLVGGRPLHEYFEPFNGKLAADLRIDDCHIQTVLYEMRKNSIYIVFKGRTTGMYYSWVECHAQVDGFPGASYQKFNSSDEAYKITGYVHPQNSIETSETVEENVSEKERKANPRVFFDLNIGSHLLFTNSTPIIVENFWALCTSNKGIGKNEKSLHYKGTTFHRVIPRCLLNGGDLIDFDELGGESIYGDSSTDEDLINKHTGPENS
ncbi:hypothetical protein Ddye_024099 [Dipteronia dyeriana]|uniref:PPIase cyclophilin-type domain-containing protein n=1 Tax=Dipteronia dyeriana TaxID=168575 RepID=A0AAD9TUT5_9ROSI|nr:hypothetical protein Ddye_024099 [Dipteronia dyeriana]